MRVALAGDVVTLTLNGEPISRYTLDEGNNRFFGLFRYSDATEVRVRKVSYRGDWARKIPPLEEQELAALPDVAPVSINVQAQPVVFKLSGDQAALAKQGLALVGGSGSAKVSGEGLALALAAGRKEGKRAGVTYKKPLVGDFEITARFKALSLDRPAAEKSARFALSISTGAKDGPGLSVA